MSKKDELSDFEELLSIKLTEDSDKLTVPNVDFIKWCDKYSKAISKKHSSGILAVATGGLSLLGRAVSKKRFGYDIFYRGQIPIHWLCTIHDDFAPFDIEKEVPLLLLRDVTGQFKLLATNMFIYFKLDKSKKMKDTHKLTVGKIPIHKIESFEVNRGFGGNSCDIFVNGELVGGLVFDNVTDVTTLTNFLLKLTPKLDKLITYRPKDKKDKSIDSEEDIPQKLEKLAKLKENGIISEEEFNNKKSELLDRM
ncbi:MAG: SHOCT domain-containing protein [Desulfarculaceae bacterium]|nr:SHOCT domain-containing protein [Desulfarculaceae bacterium]